VQLYSFFADEDHLYLILEVCCGGNIYGYLQKEGRFPEEKARGILKQVSHAIEFMHDSDIIHRDIKPENILMHEVALQLVRTFSKYAISDGQSIPLFCGILVAEHHYTPHHRWFKNNSMTTRSTFGTLVLLL